MMIAWGFPFGSFRLGVFVWEFSHGAFASMGAAGETVSLGTFAWELCGELGFEASI